MGKINKVELRKEYNKKNLDLSKNLRKFLMHKKLILVRTNFNKYIGLVIFIEQKNYL